MQALDSRLEGTQRAKLPPLTFSSLESFDVLRQTDFRTRWHHQGTPGAYKSTATGVHEYFTAMSRIKTEASTKRRDADGNLYFGEGKG